MYVSSHDNSSEFSDTLSIPTDGSSFPAGSLECFHCPHRADLYKSQLVNRPT